MASELGGLIIRAMAKPISRRIERGSPLAIGAGAVLGMVVGGVFGLVVSVYFVVVGLALGAILGSLLGAVVCPVPPPPPRPAGWMGALSDAWPYRAGEIRQLIVLLDHALVVTAGEEDSWEELLATLGRGQEPKNGWSRATTVIPLTALQGLRFRDDSHSLTLRYRQGGQTKQRSVSLGQAEARADLIGQLEACFASPWARERQPLALSKVLFAPFLVAALVIGAAVGLCQLAAHWTAVPPPPPPGKVEQDSLVQLVVWVGPKGFTWLGAAGFLAVGAWLAKRLRTIIYVHVLTPEGVAVVDAEEVFVPVPAEEAGPGSAERASAVTPVASPAADQAVRRAVEVYQEAEKEREKSHGWHILVGALSVIMGLIGAVAKNKDRWGGPNHRVVGNPPVHPWVPPPGAPVPPGNRNDWVPGKQPNPFAEMRERLQQDQQATQLLKQGLTQAREGKTADALAAYTKAIELYEPPAPVPRPGNAMLRLAHAQRAAVLSRLGRFPEAIQDLDRAIELDTSNQRGDLRARRAVAFIRLREYGRATAEAEALLQEERPSGLALYNCACVFALAAAAMTADTQLADTDRTEQAEPYAARAVALLGQARAQGYFADASRIAHAKKDADLASIRTRDDYQALLDALESAKLDRSPAFR